MRELQGEAYNMTFEDIPKEEQEYFKQYPGFVSALYLFWRNQRAKKLLLVEKQTEFQKELDKVTKLISERESDLSETVKVLKDVYHIDVETLVSTFKL